MKKLVLFVECGVGTKTASAYLVPDTYTQKDLDAYAGESALSNAEMYGIYPTSDMQEGEEDSEEYSDDIEGWWEEYNPTKHDDQLDYGSSSEFQWSEM